MTQKPFDEIKAIQAMADALDPLDDDARRRVLEWAGSKYGAAVPDKPKTAGSSPTRKDGAQPEGFEDFSDLYNAVAPKSDVIRALVAGYWYQVIEDQAPFGSQTLNSALKDLGHGVSNITKALTTLQKQKPALATQVKKAGKTQQARKSYKLTKAGIDQVGQLLAGQDASE